MEDFGARIYRCSAADALARGFGQSIFPSGRQLRPDMANMKSKGKNRLRVGNITLTSGFLFVIECVVLAEAKASA